MKTEKLIGIQPGEFPPAWGNKTFRVLAPDDILKPGDLCAFSRGDGDARVCPVEKLHGGTFGNQVRSMAKFHVILRPVSRRK